MARRARVVGGVACLSGWTCRLARAAYRTCITRVRAVANVNGTVVHTAFDYRRRTVTFNIDARAADEVI